MNRQTRAQAGAAQAALCGRGSRGRQGGRGVPKKGGRQHGGVRGRRPSPHHRAHQARRRRRAAAAAAAAAPAAAVPKRPQHAAAARAAPRARERAAEAAGALAAAAAAAWEDVPEPQRLVAGAGHDRLAVGRHGEVEHAAVFLLVWVAAFVVVVVLMRLLVLLLFVWVRFGECSGLHAVGAVSSNLLCTAHNLPLHPPLLKSAKPALPRLTGTCAP